ncbi:MAG TPA: type IA DNA topoisomerase, partial [Arsenophonus apicola]
MNLCIAEKPSVAKDIAEALGGKCQKTDGHPESAYIVVTGCYGHLRKSIEPEAHNPAYAQWTAEALPLPVYPLRDEPIAGKEAHTQPVINLI